MIRSVWLALGLERPVVGGWSDGGQVALEVGMRHPGVARALIAGGVMHNYQEEEFKSVMRSLLCVGENGVVDCDAMAAQHADLVGFVREMHVQSPEQWKTIVQQTADMWGVYPRPHEALGYGRPRGDGEALAACCSAADLPFLPA